MILDLISGFLHVVFSMTSCAVSTIQAQLTTMRNISHLNILKLKQEENMSAPKKPVRFFQTHQIGVSKNIGTPKWMVYNGKPYKNG